jgi:hypothetical protein
MIPVRRSGWEEAHAEDVVLAGLVTPEPATGS